MSSRNEMGGLKRLVLGGAVASGLMGLSGCLLDPNDYPGREHEIQSYNLRQVVTGGLFGAVPYAKTLPQAAAMNATAQVMNSNNVVRAMEFQGNSAGNSSSGSTGNNSRGGLSYGSQIERDIAQYGSVGKWDNGRDIHTIFAFESFQDFSGDRKIDPGECLGKNNSFSANEPLYIFSEGANIRVEPVGVPGYVPMRFSYFLIDLSNQNVLDKREHVRSIDEIFSYNAGFFKPGNYRAICSSNKDGVFNSLNFSVK